MTIPNVGINVDDESGMTLIELLVAVLILGTGVVAIVAMIGTGIKISGVHRAFSDGESVERSFVASGEKIALFDTAPSTPCPAAGALAPAAPASGWHLTGAISVRYWLPLGATWGTQTECDVDYEALCAEYISDGGTLATCPQAQSVGGLQEVTVSVTKDGASSDINTVTQSTRFYTRRGVEAP